MTVAFAQQYPSSSPGTDGQIIPLEVSRPEQLFSICFTSEPMLAVIPLNALWDILEVWSNEACVLGFGATPVTRPDGAGTPIAGAYRVGASTLDAPDRIILTPSGTNISVISLSNPGELFVSVLTRYQAISIDESLNRG